jgi:DNA-directed RNA polymerase beta' subunit
MQSDIYYIKNIKFVLLTHKDIIKNSVCKLDNHKLTGPGSVYDPRMGTIENNVPCAFCDKTKTCPGHFGHINLKYPLIHPLCWKLIVKYLKCFCYKCSMPLISKDMIKLFGFDKLKGEKRFKKILTKLGKIKLCSQCNTIQPKYSFVKADNTIFLIRDNKKTQLTELEIKKIFENIPDEYIELLGFDPSLMHPKNMIITVLPVIPIISRPYIRANMNLNICDDDLTTSYNEIVKANNKLNSDNLSEAKKNKSQKTIQFRVKCLFDNSHEKSKHTNGRPTKCIKKRICGKEGLIRNNIMGKRVDKSARTVIGPDPSLSIGQIALPRKFAQTLTFPDRVNRYNFDKLTTIVNSGQANFVIRNDTRMNLKYAMFRYGTHLLYGDEIHREGNVFYVTEKSKYQLQDGDSVKRNGEFLQDIKPLEKKQFNLQIGDIVERHLQDNDYVLINRQPTLHKQSILGCQIKIDDFKTIRMNLAMTKPLNADFDGDENNIHAPISYESVAEIQELCSSKNNIISAQNSKPIICIVQDALLASYLMTFYNKSLSKNRFFEIAMAINFKFDILKKIKHIRKVLSKHGQKARAFNGRGLISLILPNDLIYTQNTFKIYNGVVIDGAITKDVLGSKHNSLLKIFYKEYGPNKAQQFIDNIQFIANAWMLRHGFSIGIKDCIPSKETEIKRVVAKCILEAKGVEETTSNPRAREIKVNAALSKARDHGMKIAKDAVSDTNMFIETVTSGSKGDFFNIAQIIGLIGQQNKAGKRLAPTLNNNTRTMVHYPFDIPTKKIEYESRGFISSSFAKGLNPREFWAHAVSGRVGIIDTAMGTATSGYIQRRMVKLSEDVTIHQDSTVRNSNGSIIQFQYGDDNLDPVHSVMIPGTRTMQACNISRLAQRLNLEFESR